MSSDLEELKTIVLQENFEEDDQKRVNDVEEELQKAIAAEKLAEHPVMQEFVKYLTDRKEKAEGLLRTDRTLTERERDKVFERIDVCDHFLSILTGKEREDIETYIKQLLNAAKNLQ